MRPRGAAGPRHHALLVWGLAVTSMAMVTAGAATARPTAPSTNAGGPSARAAGPRGVVVDRLTVPAGAFVRGSSKGDDDERPSRSDTVAAFAIDRTEVTRMAYAACVATRKCKPIPAAVAGPVGGDGNLPVTGVSWFDARDFCAFAGGRLPSEAEWEKAARGTDGREFPWGGDAACDRANWGNFDGEGPCAGKNPGFPVPVGRYPSGQSPVGALDLAGNVWEWVADKYDEDPRRRIVRGGSCCSYFVPPRAANRNAWTPEYRDADLGFRCAAGRG